MIDWSRIDELRAEIGDDDIADVVALFLEEADEVVAGLAGGGLGEADLAQALHALNGAALNLGLADLAALCAAAEAEPGGPALTDIAVTYARSRAALTEALAEARAA